jgi:hypothetical protein
MNVEFDYKQEKDIENITNGLRAVNSKSPTRFMRWVIAKGEVFGPMTGVGLIDSFLREEAIDIESRIASLRAEWQPIDTTFRDRSDRLFKVRSEFWPVSTWLSVSSRCTYSIERREFFLYVLASSARADVMHELLHFYTWDALHERLSQLGLSSLEYNDLKEAMTELLNIAYSDLMHGAHDHGYPHHGKLRNRIQVLWQECNDIDWVAMTLGGEMCKDRGFSPSVH